MVAVALLAACVAVVAACGEQKQIEFAVTPEGVKTLDSAITHVAVVDQADGQSKYVDMSVATKVLWGGESDWNGVASSSHRLLTALLNKSEVSRARIVYRSTENNNFDWAQVSVARSDLPANWRELSYLQFFAVTEPVYGNRQSMEWLCDFYARYESANPPGSRHLMHCKR